MTNLIKKHLTVQTDLPGGNILNHTYKFTETHTAPFAASPATYPDSALVIQDLPLIDSCVDAQLSVGEVARLFEQHPEWPGVILTAHDQFVGLLTRRACAEFLGTFLATGFFSKIPILDFFENHPACSLVLDGGTSISEAVRAALKRQGLAVFDPIAVRLSRVHYSLLEIPALLQA
jgi:hypothetical protein